jgi:hypothetical protein
MVNVPTSAPMFYVQAQVVIVLSKFPQELRSLLD